ncbi:efflux RND transporter periplasmic adaptor subunit [Anaeromyxobacter paludicola]|uniref:Hemolysin secretion protein D n=1 Tax=Anaeromyxobacter paludicola TaxID=2918171 RepID=A0ABN6NDB9_9BACT|nr:efflux RND transporter periplasmic adaptor subunit [Anaeromyxobacter paludicola]BDG10020.1 hemolysin secretion protein D [Anaeromyxobacter paludicola]
MLRLEAAPPPPRPVAPPARRRRLAVVALALSLAAAGAFVALRARGPGPRPAVITAPVTRADVESTVLATGTLEPAKVVSVGAQVSGQVKSLLVKLGDQVKQGQLVAEIDAVPQENTLRNAEAARATVEAQRRARKAALKQAELAFARQEKLLPSEAGTRADYEAAEATLATTRAELSQLDAQLEQARIAVDTARVNLGYTRITSPMDGVVVAVVAEQGQTVNAVQTAPTIVKVAKLDTITVKAQISEADVPRVKPGLPVFFTILGQPDLRREATLRAVEPAPTSYATESTTTSSSSASSTSTAIYYNGLCDAPNADGALRISMTAQVTIVLARARQALTVPAGAVGHGPDGGATVRVQRPDGAVVSRRVRLGLDDRVQVEVLEGLAEGERVVVSEAAAAQGPGMPRPPGMF